MSSYNVPDFRTKFEIRLNTTYTALLATEESISVAVAHLFLDQMDNFISQHENEPDGITIHRYTPEQHAYSKGQHEAYLNHLDDQRSVKEVLRLGYGINKHRLSSKKADDIQRELVTLFPEQPNISVWEGAYDILDYRDSSFELRYNPVDEDKETFAFFFAIRIGTESIMELDDFLAFHLQHNFDQAINTFARFLELLCIAYQGEVISDIRCDIVQSWYQRQPLDSTSFTDPSINNEPVHGNKKEALWITLTVERTNNDQLTKLTTAETALFFSLLQESGILLKRKGGFLSNLSLTKAIQVLTGYRASSTKDELESQKHGINPETIKKVKEIFSVVGKLIDSKLTS